MVTIESDTSEINTNARRAFTYLSDLNNWQGLMPKEVTKWESQNDHCSFVLGGMASIGLRIKETISHSKISLKSEGKSPFAFDLDVQLLETGAEICSVQLVFNGDMNMMMKMMAEKPLSNFFNYLSHKMRGIQ
jgi:hypothetical protein